MPTINQPPDQPPHQPPNHPKEGRCLCGNDQPAAACCGRFLDSTTTPPAVANTAVALMRSRYVGFVTHNTDYLAATWHPTSRPGHIRLDPQRQWLGLHIVNCQNGGPSDTTGIVEFVAHYRDPSQLTSQALHEISQFVREDGRWYYLAGRHIP